MFKHLQVDWLTFFSLVFILNFFWAVSGVACEIGKPCGAKGFCVNVDKGKIECRPIPESPSIEFALPFKKSRTVVCTQSKSLGTHSWLNALYALDLATPYAEDPGQVLAAADGRAFVFPKEKNCPTPKGKSHSSETDGCGLGWGNNIKIMHGDKYYSFYVHLKKALVKDGQEVKQGEPIGIEGWTGQAGHRHLHWSVNKLAGSEMTDFKTRLSWDGESVPFKFKASIDGQLQTVNSLILNCPHSNIGQINPRLQPKFEGYLE